MQNQTSKQKVVDFFKKLGNYALILAMLVIGFFIGKFYNQIISPKEAESQIQIHTMKEISIAVNESNDLMIMDKKTGNYKIFEDSVGLTIFRMYAGKISQSNPANN
jgi:hypothetical protein